jgi:hypothetical protein
LNSTFSIDRTNQRCCFYRLSSSQSVRYSLSTVGIDTEIKYLGNLMFTIGQTTKPPSNCSTELCNSSLSSNASCSSPITCYSFRTSINTNLCAPKDDCSLFDKCINGTKCATNTSVCVVNSCCAVPICIPVVFSRICTQ